MLGVVDHQQGLDVQPSHMQPHEMRIYGVKKILQSLEIEPP